MSSTYESWKLHAICLKYPRKVKGVGHFVKVVPYLEMASAVMAALLLLRRCAAAWLRLSSRHNTRRLSQASTWREPLTVETSTHSLWITGPATALCNPAPGIQMTKSECPRPNLQCVEELSARGFELNDYFTGAKAFLKPKSLSSLK
ncbi:hypothetical protein EYF80_017992 [Liparis tanakae]|uniref:Uncharacterized protein n=1 Tax=Liparis tanakae TaxID=230148 RepID=A0A4Z2I223_9TELE|nr:hypothetical protein EYF80_017992 [Liparis tanakae]